MKTVSLFGIKATAAVLVVMLLPTTTNAQQIPEEIKTECARVFLNYEGRTNYRLYEVCIARELEALQRLEAQQAFPRRTAVQEVHRNAKPKVGDYICRGGIPCDHSDID